MLEIDIKYHGTKPDGMLQRHFDRALQYAFAQIATWYQQNRVGHHFTHAGATEYGYTPRAGQRGRLRGKFNRSYTGRKLAKHKHTLPLVYSGKSRGRAMTGRVSVTKSQGTKQHTAKISVPAPTLNRKNKDSPIVMSDEMKRISQGEARILNQMLAAIMDDFLKRPLETGATQIRAAA